MKTVFFFRADPPAKLPRALLKGAAVMAVLAMATVNMLAATVNWLSGGPNNGYPSGAGYVDGDITDDAEYNTPCGLAIDETGNYLLVADRNNNVIRVLDFSINTTSTLLTYTNYVVANNLFSQPVGVAIDDNYNIFVLNRAQNNNGTVIEFDDTSELIATNLTHITNAGGIALDPNDNIYVTASNQVWRVSNTGVISLLATVTATNSSLQGIVVRRNGLLAVCDTGRNGILLVNPSSGQVSTNAGFHGQGDFITTTDTSISNTAAFFHPYGITESGDGTLIVTDFGNDRVKAVLANGTVTNVYGVSSNDWLSPYPGFMDGTVALPDKPGGVAARCPNGVVVAPDGSLYVSEDYYHILRHITGTGFIPQPPAAPAAPTDLTATIVTNQDVVTGVYLAWDGNPSGSVTNYVVGRATSTGGPYTVIGNTMDTSFMDTNVVAGDTYFYVVQAENAGGSSADSSEVSVYIPVPPPPAPTIGWFDYELNGGDMPVTVLHPFINGPNIFNNDISIAILPNQAGVTTLYAYGPTPLSNSVTTGSSPLEVYANGKSYYPPLPIATYTNMTIAAININAEGEQSAIISDEVIYQVGNPTITGANAAQFTLNDATTNVTYLYTTDGTDPLTNAPASQQVSSTNGQPVNLSLAIGTNFTFEVRAVKPGYLPSGIASQFFSSAAFVPNTISWGFASGECSSKFVGAAGETFYAPVTLTMLPGTPIYSLQFAMTVSSTGIGITNPAPTAGPFYFQSMLEAPTTATNGLQGAVFSRIPPWAFASDYPGANGTTNLPASDYVTNVAGQIFVNLLTSNGNELAVGWVERYGATNLYNTLAQNLITYSQAHDDLFPDAAVGEPNGVIVGGYSFQISPGAVNGQQYQIQIIRPSATDDGVGAPGSSVAIFGPNQTNAAGLEPGTLNATKNVTVGSIPYLVGNVYPFGWFNAGDFGDSNLESADVEQVFESAVYDVNTPPYNSTPVNSVGGYTSVSDMYNAMDSAGGLGFVDNDPASSLYGYYTNAGPLTTSQQVALMAGNFTNINQMAFGDGKLDIADVYVTFLRSEFTNNLVWFQRVWTNGVNVAFASNPSSIISAMALQQSSGGGKFSPGLSLPSSSASITNTPVVDFTTTDYVATAGQTINIPVNANVFGPYPLRMLMLNLSIVPLDGSPALTTAVQFSPNPALNSTLGSATPYTADSRGNGNYAAAWLPSSLSPVAGFTGLANIGTLTVTIPTNATSLSAYAISFDHASASSSGLASFPRQTLTGLITLSPRNSSSYNDGIPDSWRLRYFGTVNNDLSVSNADADGTGMNNWQKYLAGLNPVNPASVFNEGTDQTVAQSPQDMVVYWPSVSGKTYVVWRSPTLFPAQWTAVSTNIGDGTYMEIHDASGGPNRYYQVTTQ